MKPIVLSFILLFSCVLSSVSAQEVGNPEIRNRLVAKLRSNNPQEKITLETFFERLSPEMQKYKNQSPASLLEYISLNYRYRYTRFSDYDHKYPFGGRGIEIMYSPSLSVTIVFERTIYAIDTKDRDKMEFVDLINDERILFFEINSGDFCPTDFSNEMRAN